MYEYRARVVEVVDGDTIDLSVDLGFHFAFGTRFRLLGINAPELHAENPAPGQAAKAALVKLCPLGSDVIVKTERDHTEKYGRFLATLWRMKADGTSEAVSVNDQLVAAGHAKPYSGRGPRT